METQQTDQEIRLKVFGLLVEKYPLKDPLILISWSAMVSHYIIFDKLPLIKGYTSEQTFKELIENLITINSFNDKVVNVVEKAGKTSDSTNNNPKSDKFSFKKLFRIF